MSKNVVIEPMDESYIHIHCLHGGPVDPASPPENANQSQNVADLPEHPWSDETITELAKQYNSLGEGSNGEPSREFMREMIQRYGSCAILAWENKKIVGQLRFYPLSIAQLLAQAAPEKQPVPAASAIQFGPDLKTLWVQCIMTSRPYIGPEPDTITGCNWPAMAKAGARKGTGLKLVRGLIPWAKEHGWKHIVKQAHADLDCMYGQYGGGGKALWEKAGFKVIGSHHDEWQKEDNWKATVESQAKAKGMTKREAWTWYRMAYEV